MLKKLFLIFILLVSINLFAKGEYEVFEKQSVDDFPATYVKVYGIDKPIELLIGVGDPEVLELETINENIKLLHCFGGDLGTSTLVGYFYTFILDFKNGNVLGMIEYYDDYGQYTNLDKKPKWQLKKDVLKVLFYQEDELKKLEFKLPNNLK